LNDASRKYYDQAFDHILNCDENFWKVDGGLTDNILLINSNNHIRTMYSKRGMDPVSTIKPLSYLEFCYSEQSKQKLIDNILPELSQKFNTNPRCSFLYSLERPKIKENEENDVHPCLKYISDPMYWNINHIRVELKGGNINMHSEFWDDLTQLLSQILK